jgi:hypothetical protein
MNKPILVVLASNKLEKIIALALYLRGCLRSFERLC